MNVLQKIAREVRNLAPANKNTEFRKTGQIRPEEFIQAGDFLVAKFRTWQWEDASHPSKRSSALPPGKQYLVTRGVPCRRRLDADFAGDAGHDETLVRGALGGEEDDWLRTGGMGDSEVRRMGEVRTVDEAGKVEEDIPDMEDDVEEEDDPEALIPDTKGGDGKTSTVRTYNLYITYSNWYSTPQMWLSGYLSPSEPLPPKLMEEDIVGDYKDKTVTFEDFPFFDSGVKMVSIHPCKHANVMKLFLDRAEAASELENAKRNKAKGGSSAEEISDNMKNLSVTDQKGKEQGEDWEVLEDQDGIRVDHYLVVFLKFMTSVTPGIEHDYTIAI